MAFAFAASEIVAFGLRGALEDCDVCTSIAAAPHVEPAMPATSKYNPLGVFARLPPELRDQLYSHLVDVTDPWSHGGHDVVGQSSPLPLLAMANHTFMREITNVYQKCRLDIHEPTWTLRSSQQDDMFQKANNIADEEDREEARRHQASHDPFMGVPLHAASSRVSIHIRNRFNRQRNIASTSGHVVCRRLLTFIPAPPAAPTMGPVRPPAAVPAISSTTVHAPATVVPAAPGSGPGPLLLPALPASAASAANPMTMPPLGMGMAVHPNALPSIIPPGRPVTATVVPLPPRPTAPPVVMQPSGPLFAPPLAWASRPTAGPAATHTPSARDETSFIGDDPRPCPKPQSATWLLGTGATFTALRFALCESPDLTFDVDRVEEKVVITPLTYYMPGEHRHGTDLSHANWLHGIVALWAENLTGLMRCQGHEKFGIEEVRYLGGMVGEMNCRFEKASDGICLCGRNI